MGVVLPDVFSPVTYSVNIIYKFSLNHILPVVSNRYHLIFQGSFKLNYTRFEWSLKLHSFRVKSQLHSFRVNLPHPWQIRAWFQQAHRALSSSLSEEPNRYLETTLETTEFRNYTRNEWRSKRHSERVPFETDWVTFEAKLTRFDLIPNSFEYRASLTQNAIVERTYTRFECSLSAFVSSVVYRPVTVFLHH